MQKRYHLPIRTIKTKDVAQSLRVLPDENYLFLRVLSEEQKHIQERIHQATITQNQDELRYWKPVIDIFHRLIERFKRDEQCFSWIETLDYFELDCLVGATEKYLTGQYLLSLKTSDTKNPSICQIEEQYQLILRIYETKKRIFEKAKQASKSI